MSRDHPQYRSWKATPATPPLNWFCVSKRSKTWKVVFSGAGPCRLSEVVRLADQQAVLQLPVAVSEQEVDVEVALLQEPRARQHVDGLELARPP